MIINHRTYNVVPRKMEQYVRLIEEQAMPVQNRHQLDLIGYFVTEVGPLNQVVHLWRYDDFADMEAKRTRRNADPAWKEYLSLTEGLVQSQEDKILRPLPFSPLR